MLKKGLTILQKLVILLFFVFIPVNIVIASIMRTPLSVFTLGVVMISFFILDDYEKEIRIKKRWVET